MKIKINPTTEINANGNNNEYCGSKNRYCRFFGYDYAGGCLLFEKDLEKDDLDFLRCKECKRSEIK